MNGKIDINARPLAMDPMLALAVLGTLGATGPGRRHEKDDTPRKVKVKVFVVEGKMKNFPNAVFEEISVGYKTKAEAMKALISLHKYNKDEYQFRIKEKQKTMEATEVVS